MNIDALIAELRDDPAALGYSAMNDEAAATALNTADRNYYVELSSKSLLHWGMKSGKLDAIAAAVDTGAPAIRAIARGVSHVLQRTDTTLDFANADDVAMVDGLVSAGIIDATDKTDLQTLATQQRSRAAELGLGVVAVGHVQEARRLT